MTAPGLYLVPNGSGSRLFCPECLEAAKALPDSPDVLRCDVGMHHAYACVGSSQSWLVGYKLCSNDKRVGLIVAAQRLWFSLGSEDRKILEGFLRLVALARG